MRYFIIVELNKRFNIAYYAGMLSRRENNSVYARKHAIKHYSILDEVSKLFCYTQKPSQFF